MVGIDLSLSPVVWAALHGRDLVHGVLDAATPAALGEALRTAGVRDRTLALAVQAVPPRDVWTGTLPPRLGTGAGARRAAVLAASQQLKVDPGSIVVSFDRGPNGGAYVAAPADAVARWAAPWQAPGWRVRVIEPAAAALLRAAGGAAVELFVRTGTGAVDLVVGSSTRWVLARTVEVDWATDLGRARVEVGDTIDLARRAGADPTGLVVGGTGPAGLLMDAIGGLVPTRPLLLRDGAEATAVPPDAVVAVAMARWASASRAATRGAPRGGGAMGGLRDLVGRLRRRSARAL